jgi:hypothetical protein
MGGGYGGGPAGWEEDRKPASNSALASVRYKRRHSRPRQPLGERAVGSRQSLALVISMSSSPLQR